MLIDLIRSGLEPRQIIYYALIYLFAMTLAFSIHEFMHAAVAVWLGDETPRNMGRLTLNPIAHIDPVGTFLILLAGFGWGKPVMYNPSRLNRFRSHRWMNIMVHLAGVTGNFVLGIVCTILSLLFGGLAVKFPDAALALRTVSDAMSFTVDFSMMLLAFNLLPIPPLDGFHVLEEALPYKWKSTNGYRKFQQFSPMAIWIVFILSITTGLPLLSKIIEIVETPFVYIISLISVPFIMFLQALGMNPYV